MEHDMNDMSNVNSDSEPVWRQLKLSLERPYKDDFGNRIPIVKDITPEGEYIYEPYVEVQPFLRYY